MASSPSKREDALAIAHRIDDQLRRVWMKSAGAATGAEVAAFIVELTAARPDLQDYDFIHDLRETSGEVRNDDVERVATSCADRPSPQTYTVFITPDPAFASWPRTMDFQFPHRRHYVASTPAAADDLFRRLRAGTLAPKPGP